MSNRKSNVLRLAVAGILSWVLLLPAFGQQQTPVVAFSQPSSANAGDAAFNLTLTGVGFAPGCIVYWNAQALQTFFLSENQISATVRAELLTTAGQAAVSVANPTGARSTAVVFTVLGAPLTIVASALAPAQAGIPYSHNLVATGGAAPYMFAVTDALPAGLTLTPAGLLSGLPAATGSFTFNVRVTDAAQRTATTAVTLSVTAAPLTIASAAELPAATEGMAYSQVLRVVSGTGPFRWSAGGPLPAGLTLDAATGTLQGVPPARGVYSFVMQVTDGTGASATKTFSLTVQSAPLVITTVSPLFGATLGAAYSQTFSAAGGTRPYVWTMASPVAGVALDRASGTLTGTPSQTGTYTLSVQVADSAGVTVSKGFTLTVAQPQLSIANASPLPQGTVGVPYQQRFLANGGSAPYSWSISSGSIPGLVLDGATGVLASTPATPGVFAFNVTVRDSGNITATRPFTIRIAAGPLRLAPLTETLRSSVNSPFALSLTVAGGTPPYAWSANGLPDGLQIDPASGAVSGILRTVGSLLFTIRVTDADRAAATELVSLEVSAPPLPALRTVEIPESMDGAQQADAQLRLSAPYSLPLDGQLTLSFAPDSATGDPAVQFSSGGRTVDFQIPAGATEARFAAGTLGLQTGTVSGTITLSARLQTGGVILTPTPLTLHTIAIRRAAPVITSVSFTRSGSVLEVRFTGYSTSREITQGVFQFRAGAGNTLATREVSLVLEETFGRWFRDPASAAFGGQFFFTQQFAVQGDVNAVIPVSATLSNRVGATLAEIRE